MVKRLLLSVLAAVCGHAQFFGGLLTPDRIKTSTFSQLGAPADGHVRFCTDCQTITPCTSGGPGAFAFRQGGVWECATSTSLPSLLSALNALGDCGDGRIPMYFGGTFVCSGGAAPSDGQILKWNGGTNRYEAGGNMAEAVQSWVDLETPGGSINGSNAVFTLSAAPTPPGSLLLWRNGILQRAPADYTLAGSTITFVAMAKPQTGDSLTATFRSLTGAPGDPVTSVNGATGNVVLTPAGDVTGSIVATNVGRLQGRDVFNAAPLDGQVLTWTSANSRWQPATPSGGGGGSSIPPVVKEEFLVSAGTIVPGGTISMNENWYYASSGANTQAIDSESGMMGGLWLTTTGTDNTRATVDLGNGGAGSRRSFWHIVGTMADNDYFEFRIRTGPDVTSVLYSVGFWNEPWVAGIMIEYDTDRAETEWHITTSESSGTRVNLGTIVTADRWYRVRFTKISTPAAGVSIAITAAQTSEAAARTATLGTPKSFCPSASCDINSTPLATAGVFGANALNRSAASRKLGVGYFELLVQ